MKRFSKKNLARGSMGEVTSGESIFGTFDDRANSVSSRFDDRLAAPAYVVQLIKCDVGSLKYVHNYAFVYNICKFTAARGGALVFKCISFNGDRSLAY